MNAEETKQAAVVMIAHSEGKKVESREWNDGDWKECHQPIWNWHRWNYRIAPEPLEVEVWVHKDGTMRFKEELMPGKIPEKYGWTLRRATIHPEEVTP